MTSTERANLSTAEGASFRKVISGEGASRTLLASESGATVLYDRAAGIIYTLPAPVVGLEFDFVTTVSVTGSKAT